MRHWEVHRQPLLGRLIHVNRTLPQFFNVLTQPDYDLRAIQRLLHFTYNFKFYHMRGSNIDVIWKNFLGKHLGFFLVFNELNHFNPIVFKLANIDISQWCPLVCAFSVFCPFGNLGQNTLNFHVRNNVTTWSTQNLSSVKCLWLIGFSELSHHFCDFRHWLRQLVRLLLQLTWTFKRV